MRIVSLLPSATEIVCALGARHQLVGRSHECDFPADVAALPVLTSTKVKPSPSSLAIDKSVRDVLKQALAVYDVDERKLAELAPDIIVTQDLCDVCAVSYDQVCAAAKQIAGKEVKIVSLHPTRFGEIFDDIRKVAAAIGREAEGAKLLADLDGRVKKLADRAKFNNTKPSILTIEWLDPVMIGGTWMPEMAELASAEALLATAGKQAQTVDLKTLESIDPEVVLIKPCGFGIDRIIAELPVLQRNLPWSDWTAPLQGRVYAADGNQFFNRPGPRIVDSLEIMAACIHPKQFRDFRIQYSKSVIEIEQDLNVKRWSEEYIGL
ncbi:MAG: ABC transporter substrate-binding protein [Planctomycetes bacterium]|nr:ABC transporter substrate-binding protein [Planctomycetota bacterium]